MPYQRTEETRIRRLQVRGYDARLHAVGGYTLRVKAGVQGAGVDDGGDFRVPVSFPLKRVNVLVGIYN